MLWRELRFETTDYACGASFRRMRNLWFLLDLKGVEISVIRLPCHTRVDADELVDDPKLSVEDAFATMRDQAVVNRWLGGAHATLAHAIPLLRNSASDPVRVLDAACGGGDLSRFLVDAARRHGKRTAVIGLDLSRHVITCARRLSADYPEIRFVVGDALRPPFREGTFDIVIMPTFIHHLQPEQIVPLLRTARGISRGAVIVEDLVRSPWACLGFWIFSRVMRFHPISIHDGQVSVCRAYIPREIIEMVHRAGLAQWKLYRHPISRMTLVYAGTSHDEKEATA